MIVQGVYCSLLTAVAADHCRYAYSFCTYSSVQSFSSIHDGVCAAQRAAALRPYHTSIANVLIASPDLMLRRKTRVISMPVVYGSLYG